MATDRRDAAAFEQRGPTGAHPTRRTRGVGATRAMSRRHPPREPAPGGAHATLRATSSLPGQPARSLLPALSLHPRDPRWPRRSSGRSSLVSSLLRLERAALTDHVVCTHHGLRARDSSRGREAASAAERSTRAVALSAPLPRSSSAGDTQQGYEYAPDQCIPITDADLAAVPLKTVRVIEIERFVRRADIAAWSSFSRQAYYVTPDPVGLRAAALLAWVLAKRRLVAVCKVVLTNRESLSFLAPLDGALVLTTTCWPDEIRATTEVALPAVSLKPAERAMAEQLVAAMTGAFDPAAHTDDYRDALMTVIECKVAGLPPAAKVDPQHAGTIVDLMAALEASVAAARARTGASEITAPTVPQAVRPTKGVPGTPLTAAPSPEPDPRAGRRRRPAA